MRDRWYSVFALIETHWSTSVLCGTSPLWVITTRLSDAVFTVSCNACWDRKLLSRVRMRNCGTYTASDSASSNDCDRKQGRHFICVIMRTKSIQNKLRLHVLFIDSLVLFRFATSWQLVWCHAFVFPIWLNMAGAVIATIFHEISRHCVWSEIVFWLEQRSPNITTHIQTKVKMYFWHVGCKWDTQTSGVSHGGEIITPEDCV